MRGLSASALTWSNLYLRDAGSMTWELAKAIFRVCVNIGLAVGLVSLLQVLGDYLRETVSTNSWLPSRVASLTAWLGQPPPPQINYQTIVTSALAVTGTLVGVYFATVAFVVSTTYKDASTEVRALVTRLPGGRAYTFVYTQAVLFGLVVLGLPMANREPNRLSLCVVAILGGFVVLSFGRLRNQLYGLLEPVGLLAIVDRDISRAVSKACRLATSDSNQFRVQLYRAKTLESLRVLRDLCRLIRERERVNPNTPVGYVGIDPRIQRAARYVRTIWLRYSARKRELLDLSEWFFARQLHKDWLVATEGQVEIALTTSTTLQAASAENTMWFEDQLVVAMRELIGGRDVSQLSSILTSINDPVQQLVSRGMFAEAKLWMEHVVGSAQSVTASQMTKSGTENKEEKFAHSLPEDSFHDLVDFIALAHTCAVLGLRDYVHNLTVDFPNWMVKQAFGENVRHVGPITGGLFKNVRQALQFERSVEGCRVTSDANINQLIAQAIASEAIDEAMLLMDQLDHNFWPWVKRVSERNSLASGAALSRCDELIHKWEQPLEQLKILFELCEGVHRDVDDRWPDLRLDSFADKLAIMRKDIKLPIARLAASVDSTMDSRRPDVFGWAFYRAHQDLLNDVLCAPKAGVEGLDERFRGVILASERARERLTETVRRQHVSVLGSVRAEPMLMVLQLSGVALVNGRVRNYADLLRMLGNVWGRLLDTNAQQVLDASIAALVLDQSLFGISSGKITRSGRDRQALLSFNDLNGSHSHMRYTRRKHASSNLTDEQFRLLRSAEIYSFEEVFIAAWLAPECSKRGVRPSEGLLEGRLEHLVDEFSSVPSSRNGSSPDCDEG